MKNLTKLWIARIVLFVLIFVCFSVFICNEAGASGFDALPTLSTAGGDSRATINNIRRAKAALAEARAGRNGYVLGVIVGDEIYAVSVNPAGRSRDLRFITRRVRANGVNSHFEVVEPYTALVLALRRRVLRDAVIYSPWSPELDSLELRQAGLEHLNALLDRSSARLAGIRSLSDPRKQVPEVVPRDVLFTLLVIEHIDGAARFRDEDFVPQVMKVLVTVGANGSDSYRYARSPAGARGISQFMPATYAEVRRAYPRARLQMSFLRAMRSHEESVSAMYCLVDMIMADLPPWQRARLMRDPTGLSLGLYIAAAYNTGTERAWQMYNRYRFRRRHHGAVGSRMYLGKFEALWNLRN